MDLEDSGCISPWIWGFQPGDRVRVVDGTFVGKAGEILSHEQVQEYRQNLGMPRCRSAWESVWVMIEIFGRAVPVDLLPG